MSAFTPTTEETTTGNQETGEGNQTSWLDKIASEKGDQWKDPEVIAKGYAHAQVEIERLKAKEEEFQKNDYAKALLETLQENQDAGSASGNTGESVQSGAGEETHTGANPEDVQRLIEEALVAKDAEAKATTNMVKVNDALKQSFGTEAEAKVKEKATELNLSLEYMEDLAKTSPSAFLALMGEAEQKNTNRQATNGVNTDSGNFTGQSGERNQAYYNKMRRENRKLYYAEATQLQMLDDRRKLGERFYNH